MRPRIARLRTTLLVGAVRRVNGMLGRRGFAVVQASPSKTQGSEATSLLVGMSTDRPITLAVVGAGLAGPSSDPGVWLLREHPERVALAVLVEPIPERASALESHLEGLQNVRVVQRAAGTSGVATLTVWQTDDWADEQLVRRAGGSAAGATGGRSWTSGRREHVAEHLAGALGISTTAALAHVVAREVAAQPLGVILDEAGVDRLDYLQIDTEGFDDVVLLSLDLDRHRPAIIRFERIHLGPDRLERLDVHLRGAGYFHGHDSGFDRVYIRPSSWTTRAVSV